MEEYIEIYITYNCYDMDNLTKNQSKELIQDMFRELNKYIVDKFSFSIYNQSPKLTELYISNYLKDGDRYSEYCTSLKIDYKSLLEIDSSYKKRQYIMEHNYIINGEINIYN